MRRSSSKPPGRVRERLPYWSRLSAQLHRAWGISRAPGEAGRYRQICVWRTRCWCARWQPWSKSKMDRGLCHGSPFFANTLLTCTFATVKYWHAGSGGLRNLPVTTVPSSGRIPVRAGNLNRRARLATVKGVLVEENSAVVLGDHVKFLRQGTMGDEAGPFLHADHMPTCQRARVRTSRRSRVPRKDLEQVRATAVVVVRSKRRSGKRPLRR